MAIPATSIPPRCAATLARERGRKLKIGCDRVLAARHGHRLRSRPVAKAQPGAPDLLQHLTPGTFLIRSNHVRSKHTENVLFMPNK